MTSSGKPRKPCRDQILDSELKLHDTAADKQHFMHGFLESYHVSFMLVVDSKHRLTLSLTPRNLNNKRQGGLILISIGKKVKCDVVTLICQQMIN